MNETTFKTTPTINNASSPVASAQENPARMQVSCIKEDDVLFLSPRPFSFSRKEYARTNRSYQANDNHRFQHTDDVVNYAVRYVRRVGYALIFASILLLIIDGVLRNTFGL